MSSFLQHLSYGPDSMSCANHNGQSNLPFGLPRKNILTRALLNIQQFASTSLDVRIDLPTNGEVRMRNLVHRGAQRPVSKATSIKLDRVVHCESVLEHEAFLLLEVSPSVHAFSEQPVRIRYMQENEWRSHIPDFVMIMGDRITFVEVKFSKDVDELVNARTRLMKKILNRFGVDYRLVTEDELRKGVYVQNAMRILRRARHAINDVQLLASLERLRSVDRLPLAAFGWSVAESTPAIGIAKLIMSGHAAIDENILLSDWSYVWVTKGSQNAGGVV